MKHINDKWVFFFVYPLIGIGIVHIGNDNSLQKLLRIPSYYTDVLLAITNSFLIGFYLRWLNKRIDNQFDWHASLKSRIIHQLIWGILIPTLFAVIAEIVYLIALDISLAESSIFYLELPLIIVFLLLINFIYFVLYFRQHTSNVESSLDEQVKENEASKEIYLIARQGIQNVQVSNESIAYFITKDKLTFLVTTDNRQLLFDKPIKDVMEILSKNQYYRLNRQLIAKRDSIVKWTSTETRRLKVVLNPPYEKDVFVSKSNVSPFIKWLEQY